MTESAENEPRRSPIAEIVRLGLEQERASFEAQQNAARLAHLRDRPRGRGAGVFSMRLDPTEMAMLEARAAAAGIGPSVLARNLIRMGLMATDTGNLAVAIERVEAAVATLRATVG